MSISIVNPHILDFIETITREVYSSGYQAGRITTTGSTYQTAATVSTTESSGTNYAAFWQATGDNSATTSDFRARLFETSERQFSNIEPQDSTDALSVGGVYPYAGGTNKTHQIQYASEATTAGIAGRALNVLQLDASDKWAFNSGTTNATANAVSITITEAGDYLVIGSGMLSAGEASAEIFDGTNSYGAVDRTMQQDASTFSPFWQVVKLSLTNETLSVRVTTGTIRQASILALKLDKFENVYYSEQTTQQTTSSNTFVDAFTYTPTLVNPGNYHLILGCGQLQINSTRNSAAAKLTNQSRGTNYNVAHFRENNATNEWYPTPVARISSFVDSSPTLAWEFYSEGNNNTARLRNMAIAVLDLGIAAPAPYFIGVTTVVDSSSITLSDQIEEGDIVIIAGHSTNTSIATPTGYTAGQSGVSNTVNYNWSFKIQGATPDTTADGLTTGANVKYIAMVFRYLNTSTVLNTAISTAGSGLPNSPSITTTNPSIILSIGFLDDDEVLADTTAPIGYTLCGVEQAGGTIMAAYKVQTAAGTDDPGAFGGSGSDTWVATTVSLRLA